MPTTDFMNISFTRQISPQEKERMSHENQPTYVSVGAAQEGSSQNKGWKTAAAMWYMAENHDRQKQRKQGDSFDPKKGHTKHHTHTRHQHSPTPSPTIQINADDSSQDNILSGNTVKKIHEASNCELHEIQRRTNKVQHQRCSSYNEAGFQVCPCRRKWDMSDEMLSSIRRKFKQLIADTYMTFQRTRGAKHGVEAHQTTRAIVSTNKEACQTKQSKKRHHYQEDLEPRVARLAYMALTQLEMLPRGEPNLRIRTHTIASQNIKRRACLGNRDAFADDDWWKARPGGRRQDGYGMTKSEDFCRLQISNP